MSVIPEAPFLTKRFGPDGGGIDFLGMRRENLRMLQDYLIPGINNATQDFGTFCLATWIPWKFQKLARGKDRFTLSQYNRFREIVEIAIAHCIRDDSPSNAVLGPPRLRIGVQQKADLNQTLTFKAVGRTDATSLFAAPLYGPSLRYLKLIAGDALAEDSSSTGIPVTSQDELTEVIVDEVETSLRSCQEFAILDRLDPPTFTAEGLDQLGLHGLNPSYYRRVRPEVKQAFLQKLLVPQTKGDQADYRRLTARLLCESIRQHEFTKPDELRACWYSGLLPTGAKLRLVDDELVLHREKWALFHARQLQRTISETFLRCFEIGLSTGAQKIPDIVEYWRKISPADFRLEGGGTLEQFIRAEGSSVTEAIPFEEMSLAWHDTVHGHHPNYDDIVEGELSGELRRAVRMLARWWIRMQHWLEHSRHSEFIQFGSRDRMSLRWFAEWLRQRLSKPLAVVVEDCLSEVVFSQHIKVALARFDGQVQRLRFTLGDTGIIPTPAALLKLGQTPVRMADRLESFMSLLADLDVIEWVEGNLLKIGSQGNFTLSMPYLR